MASPGYKKCIKCEETKAVSEFYRKSTSRDGRMHKCKACDNARKLKWEREHPELRAAQGKRYRLKNPEKVVANRRNWRIENPEQRAAGEKRSRDRNPLKTKARAAVTRAVHRGKIVKPQHCEDCGQSATGRALHGHHEDYSKPMDVDWLCHPCHAKRHGNTLRV